jgi:hypothetical protein
MNQAVFRQLLNRLASDLAAEAKTVSGVIASDIIEYIPSALQLVQKHEL